MCCSTFSASAGSMSCCPFPEEPGWATGLGKHQPGWATGLRRHQPGPGATPVFAVGSVRACLRPGATGEAPGRSCPGSSSVLEGARARPGREPKGQARSTPCPSLSLHTWPRRVPTQHTGRFQQVAAAVMCTPAICRPGHTRAGGGGPHVPPCLPTPTSTPRANSRAGGARWERALQAGLQCTGWQGWAAGCLLLGRRGVRVCHTLGQVCAGV